MLSEETRVAAVAAAHAIKQTLFMRMFALICVWMKQKRSARNKLRYSYKEKIPKQVEYMRGLISDENSACLDELRLPRNVFLKLCGVLQEKANLKPSKYVDVPEMVAIFLGILSHDNKTRIQKHAFKRSMWTVSKHFNTVLLAVLSLREEFYIKPKPIPKTETSRFRFFENCLGALDGSHISLRVKDDWKPRFRNRKGQISTNVLGVCDDSLNFIYVLSGWEGSAYDSRVLKSALTRQRNPFRVKHGFYYLCDNGYTNCEEFLAPYRSVRYHLKEWGVGPKAPQNAREYFNMRHSSARNVIERAWDLLKIRWGILRSENYYPIRTTMRIVIACALLHNFIRQEMHSDPWECEIPEGFQDGDGEAYLGVESEDIHVVGGSLEWNNWRDELANNMYQSWLSSRRGS